MSTAPRLNSMNSTVEYRVYRAEDTLSGLFTSMQNPVQSPLPPFLSPSFFSTKTFPDIQFAFSALFSYYKKGKYSKEGVMYHLCKYSEMCVIYSSVLKISRILNFPKISMGRCALYNLIIGKFEI